MDSLLSFPVGLFHPLQHAGLSRRTRFTDYLSKWIASGLPIDPVRIRLDTFDCIRQYVSLS
jgi:hypothetical protein